MMQRLNALSVAEVQASALVVDETVAVKTCSCWASFSRSAVAGDNCEVANSKNMLVAVPNAVKVEFIVGLSRWQSNQTG